VEYQGQRFLKIEAALGVIKQNPHKETIRKLYGLVADHPLGEALNAAISFPGNLGLRTNANERELARLVIFLTGFHKALDDSSNLDTLRLKQLGDNTDPDGQAFPKGGKTSEFTTYIINTRHKLDDLAKRCVSAFIAKSAAWTNKFDPQSIINQKQKSINEETNNKLESISRHLADLRTDVKELQRTSNELLGNYTTLSMVFGELKANMDERMLSFTSVQARFAEDLVTHSETILQVQKKQRDFEKKTSQAITDISKSIQQGFAQSAARLRAIDTRVKGISSDVVSQALKQRQLERSQAESTVRTAAIDKRVKGISEDVVGIASNAARQGKLIQSLASSVDASKQTLNEMAKSVQAAHKRISSLETLLKRVEGDCARQNTVSEARLREIEVAQEDLARRYGEIAAVSVEALAGMYILASINRVQNHFLSRAIAASTNFINIADGIDKGKQKFEANFSEWQAEFSGVFSCVDGLLDLASEVPFFGEIPKLAKTIFNKAVGAGTLPPMSRVGRSASETDVSGLTGEGEEPEDNLQADLDTAAESTVSMFLELVGLDDPTGGVLTDAAAEQLGKFATSLSPLKKATVAVLGRVISGAPAFTIGLVRIQTETGYKALFCNLRDQMLNQSLSIIAEASSSLGDIGSVRYMVQQALLDPEKRDLAGVADTISTTFLAAWAPMIKSMEDAGRKVGIVPSDASGDFWYFRFICAFGAVHGAGKMEWQHLHYRRSTPFGVLQYFEDQGLAVSKGPHDSLDIYNRGLIPIADKTMWTSLAGVITDNDRNHKTILSVVLVKLDLLYGVEGCEGVWDGMLRGRIPNWKPIFRETVRFIGGRLDPTKKRNLLNLSLRKDIDQTAADQIAGQLFEEAANRAL